MLFVPEGWGHATILGSYAALGQRKMGMERMDEISAISDGFFSRLETFHNMGIIFVKFLHGKLRFNNGKKNSVLILENMV